MMLASMTSLSILVVLISLVSIISNRRSLVLAKVGRRTRR
jgi:hypothetical protein